MEIVQTFKNYRVIRTGLKNGEGKQVFFVIKIDNEKNRSDYLSKSNGDNTPFHFSEDTIFTEDYIVVRSGALFNERNEVIKKTFILLSTKDWKPVILAEIGKNIILKCTDPVYQQEKITFSLVLPKEIRLEV